MNSYSDSSFSGREMRLAAIAVACGVAVLLWLGGESKPAPPPPAVANVNFQSRFHGLPNPMEANPEEHAAVLKRLAERSGGDYSRLNEDERTWLDAVGGGMGAEVLRNEVQILAMQRARAQAKSRQHARHTAHTKS